MFDLNSVLRAEPGNVPALCGRALLHLALDQQKVPPPPWDCASGKGAGEGARFGGAAFSTPKAGGSGVGPSWLDDVPHAHLPWGSRELPRFPHAPDGWGCSLK